MRRKGFCEHGLAFRPALTYTYTIYIYHAECGFSTTPRKMLQMLGNTASGSPMRSLFEDPLALLMEDPDALGERRYIAIGFGHVGELLVVVYSERAEEYRLISARRATRKERKAYEG